jgi:hypothetical protein
MIIGASGGEENAHDESSLIMNVVAVNEPIVQEKSKKK